MIGYLILQKHLHNYLLSTIPYGVNSVPDILHLGCEIQYNIPMLLCPDQHIVLEYYTTKIA